MGQMKILGSHDMIRKAIQDNSIEVSGGDTRIAWPEDVTEEKADDIFNRLIEQGFKGYKTDKSPGEPIRKFDPEAKELYVAPPMAGGC
jgi:hypothetical protein